MLGSLSVKIRPDFRNSLKYLKKLEGCTISSVKYLGIGNNNSNILGIFPGTIILQI